MSYKLTTQNPRELEAFLDWIEASRINVYLEIGLYAGATFKAVYDRLMKVWDNDTSKFLLLGIDLPSNSEAFKACNDVLAGIPTAKVWWTSSTDPQTVEEVVKAVTDRWVATGDPFKSLMFLDGDHSYAQSRDDYLAYNDAFTYIAFNDISPGTVAQNKMKHGGREVATAYHLYDVLKIGNGVDEVAYWDSPEGGKYRGIGVLA